MDRDPHEVVKFSTGGRVLLQNRCAEDTLPARFLLFARTTQPPPPRGTDDQADTSAEGHAHTDAVQYRADNNAYCGTQH